MSILTTESLRAIKARASDEFARGMKIKGRRLIDCADLLTILAAYEELERKVTEQAGEMEMASAALGSKMADLVLSYSLVSEDRDTELEGRVRAEKQRVLAVADLEQARKLLDQCKYHLEIAQKPLASSWWRRLRHPVAVSRERSQMVANLKKMQTTVTNFLAEKEGGHDA